MPPDIADPPAHSRFLIRDAMVLVAGLGISVALLLSDLNPRNRERVEWLWGLQAYALIDPEARWSIGLPLVMWYVLAGPTVVGPLVAWRHRKTPGHPRYAAGRFVWMSAGVLILLELAVAYGSCSVVMRFASNDHQWQRHDPVVAGCIWLMQIIGTLLLPLFVGYLFIPLFTSMAFVVGLAGRGRKFHGKVLWADWLGFVIGGLWCLRAAWLAYLSFTSGHRLIEL